MPVRGEQRVIRSGAPSRKKQFPHDEPSIPVLRSGAFVVVVEGADGIGRSVDVQDGHVEIEYFVSPVGPQLVRRVARRAQVREVELPRWTSVFWQDGAGAWRRGHVDGGRVAAAALNTREDHYHVRFPNQLEGRIPASEVHVRWAHPIADPIDYLAARITDTPFYFQGRQALATYLARQRGSFGGITALAASGIEFYPHQISAVQKVLSDPVQRYLLADEVGLGKTIEAGILIRQHLIDFPHTARVLVVVPDHLQEQWQEELRTRFSIRRSDPIFFATYSELLATSSSSAKPFTLLVVDEIHQPALGAFERGARTHELFERLVHFARTTPRILLLSGTPVLHQEDGFLAMLHLLDPAAYPLEEREAFRRRVAERAEVAQCAAELADETPAMFAENAVERLASLFQDDTRLTALCEAARRELTQAGDTSSRQATRALRRHVVETYRLHRRIIRTRREDPRLKEHLARRPGLERIPCTDPAREAAAKALARWYGSLPLDIDGKPPESARSLFATLVEASLSHPWVLARVLRQRQAALTMWKQVPEPLGVPSLFANEAALVSEVLQRLDELLTDEPRVQRLVEWLRTTKKKCVVFVDDEEVAERVVLELRAAIGPNAVAWVGELQAGSDSEREAEEEDGDEDPPPGPVARFGEGTATRVLVCDRQSEEGLNLQRIRASVVFYDHPLSPPRIEQRIGRVDRLEALAKLQFLGFEPVGAFEEQWLKYLEEAVGLFRQSVAPLQYVLARSVERVRHLLASAGAEAISIERGRLLDPQEGLEAERRRILEQDLLDALEAKPGEEQRIEAMGEEDERSGEDAPDAFAAWLEQRLQFRRDNSGDDTFSYVHTPDTKLPLLDVLERFFDHADRQAAGRRRRDQFPLGPFTFERDVSEEGTADLLRVGHPFVEAVEALLHADDRGAAFACCRYEPSLQDRPASLYFRFDFVVQADVSSAQDQLPSDWASPEALRRRANALFPVMQRILWFDANGQHVEDSALLQLLEQPYSRRLRPDGGRDVNLRQERWKLADALLPIPDWNDLCHRVRERAEEVLRSGPDFVSACEAATTRLREETFEVDAILESRLSRLSGAVREAETRAALAEKAIAQSLTEGVARPAVRLDSVGAIYLGGMALEVTD
ncbi:protein DpdE [Corallococcus sp. bb12-1]|uniref:protein DpdE n=1 Tax=Corallococcus sp. bb12-1 TaxID=2996784 RepID=UPI002270F2C6|nr:protein DpdE [Corallococcus sp. bb12-1]MCY1045632.1 protein DpdE [Corallococcus sp. bb12-1]